MRRGGIFLRILCHHADNAMHLPYNANEPHLKTMVRARVCVITLHLRSSTCSHTPLSFLYDFYEQSGRLDDRFILPI